MRNKIRNIVVVVLALCLFGSMVVGCTKMQDKIVGTYCGKNGSVLVLFEGGDADYYYIGLTEVSQGNTWGYNKNADELRVQMMSMLGIPGYSVYADMSNGVESFTLEARGLEAIMWDAEEYIRVSDETEHLDVEACNALIEEHIGIDAGSDQEDTEQEDSASGTETNTEAATDAASEGDDLDPELVEMLTSYEAFVDSYVDFFEAYMADPMNAISMADDYLEMMSEMEEYSNMIDNYDTSNMTEAELEYFTEVTVRCTERMASIVF